MIIIQSKLLTQEKQTYQANTKEIKEKKMEKVEEKIVQTFFSPFYPF